VLVRTDRRPAVAVAVLATLLVVLVVVLATGGSSTPARVRPVPHSANAAQEARNLRAWLLDYSR
jgi:hypothetical protein